MYPMLKRDGLLFPSCHNQPLSNEVYSCVKDYHESEVDYGADATRTKRPLSGCAYARHYQRDSYPPNHHD